VLHPDAGELCLLATLMPKAASRVSRSLFALGCGHRRENGTSGVVICS
jgi:hypothetical protein